MKVSVIIPIYNSEKYFARCIKSVFGQTYSDLEIILVDDGSKDKSGDMCDLYAEENNRVRVIHKANGGLSSARNAGLEMSTGDVIFFLDSDDYISSECISNLVKDMERFDADISIIRMKYIPENENREFFENDIYRFKVMNSEQAIEESLYQKLFTCCAPAKLYKRDVIGEIRFPTGKISEDLATCHLFLDNAKTIVYSNYCGYYYRQHELSIMHEFNEKRMDALEWANEIEKFCMKKYPDIISAAYCRTFNVAIHLLLDIPAGENNISHIEDELWINITRTRLNVIMDRKSRNREKIAAILSFFGKKLLRNVWNYVPKRT